MRAVQYRTIGASPEVVEIETPEPGPGQIRLKVTAAGLCHSDEFVMSLPADRFNYPLPMTLGHEVCAEVIGLGAAVDYLQSIGMEHIAAREGELLAHATEAMQAIPGLRILGTAPGKAAVISFLVDGAHAHDLATLLDLEGVAVRSGQHCAHPLLQWFGVAATLRASLAFYHTHDEIERFVAALERARRLLQ